MVRDEPARKGAQRGSNEGFTLKKGNVVHVEEKKVGKDGVERVKVKLDMADEVNEHHHGKGNKHNDKSGWIRTSDHHGPYVEDAGTLEAPTEPSALSMNMPGSRRC